MKKMQEMPEAYIVKERDHRVHFLLASIQSARMGMGSKTKTEKGSKKKAKVRRNGKKLERPKNE